jgi:signal transduction histidine kinase
MLLLADKQAEKFGKGEIRLLSTGLGHYARLVECVCYTQARVWVQAYHASANGYEKQAEMSHTFTKNEIVSLVGHELRAPLSVIKGYAGLLQMYGDASQEQAMTPERQHQCIDAILEQTRFLEVLVNDLLDIPRLQHGKLALRPALVDVGALCRQITQSGQLRADQQEPGKHQLVCHLDRDLPPLQVDADRLRQVLLNTVENAIKYSPQGGRIELAARCTRVRAGQCGPAQIWISIRDQGIGIPRQHIARLFQPFERLERSATSHVSGFGLGLYIARSLVEAMGGTLNIHSCEGSGTDVTIHFETVIQAPSLLA